MMRRERWYESNRHPRVEYRDEQGGHQLLSPANVNSKPRRQSGSTRNSYRVPLAPPPPKKLSSGPRCVPSTSRRD